jgi:hypothetical protein
MQNKYIGSPINKTPPAPEAVEEEVIATPTPEEQVVEVETPETSEVPAEEVAEEPAAEIEPPIDAETFYALPPKDAYQAYLDQKTAKEQLQSEVDTKVSEAIEALRTELEGKHSEEIEAIKKALKEAIYEN